MLLLATIAHCALAELLPSVRSSHNEKIVFLKYLKFGAKQNEFELENCERKKLDKK